MKERLQKVIAQAGQASRRKAEELILAGHVSVNGQIVCKLGSKVDVMSDFVAVRGKKVTIEEKATYVFNKPKGVICSNYDPQHRTRVVDLIKKKALRLYTVGRLDFNSRGLILVTNDGDLAQKITHPKHHIEKTYEVVLNKYVSEEDLAKIKRGMRIDNKKVRVLSINKIRNKAEKLKIKIQEGRNRILKRMFQALRYKVKDLKRTKIGFLDLGSLPEGEYRKLSRSQVAQFKKLAGFSLLEVVTALAIFSIGLMALMLLFPATISETKDIEDYTKAVFLGQAKMEEIKAKYFNDIPLSGTHGGFLSYCEDTLNHQGDYKGYRWLCETNSGSEDLGEIGAKTVPYKEIALTVYWVAKGNEAYNSAKHNSLKFKRFFSG